MLRYIGPALLITCVLALGGDAFASSAPAQPDPRATPSPAYCGAEDAPTWDWTQCGNRKRGIVTLYGTPMVVGVCKFNRLWAQGRIRHTVRFDGHTYETLPRLRGDRYARTLTDCPWRFRRDWRIY